MWLCVGWLVGGEVDGGGGLVGVVEGEVVFEEVSWDDVVVFEEEFGVGV